MVCHQNVSDTQECSELQAWPKQYCGPGVTRLITTTPK
jgi:hypothetical protein